MIRKWLGAFLIWLANRIDPSRQPVPAPRNIKLNASNQVRVPAIKPKVLASYWCESLDFFDMKAIAARGNKEIKPVVCYDLNTVTNKAALAGYEQEDDLESPGTDVQVVLTLWELTPREKRNLKGRRHPLIAVPATLMDDNLLAPRMDTAPILNERYLSSTLGAGCFCLGESNDANELLYNVYSNLIEDETASPGWATWWNTCLGVILTLIKANTSTDAQHILAVKANELLDYRDGDPVQWKLSAAVYPSLGSGSKMLSEVYRSLIEHLSTLPEETALFRRFCGTNDTLPLTKLTSHRDANLLGHIDEYEDGSRALFPLDPTQRNAVRAILSLTPGELQAINGPPGSGKTSMLRAVVASRWVAAALMQDICPIVVACGATNQSVTNVIGAFGNAPHPDGTIAHAQRWIPDVISYGAYYPASSVLSDPGKQSELAKFICLRQANNGFLFEYVNRSNALDPAKSLDYENTYLNLARAALNKPAIATIEEAVQTVWECLSSVDQLRHHFADALLTNSKKAFVIAVRYLTEVIGHWTPARQSIAKHLLATLRRQPENITAAEEFMDITWRAEAFHWAARYWEGRFLLAQRELLFSRHPNNVEEALRRLCMLTPCLVSTLHTVPRFARIDDSTTQQNDQRTFYFGLFDLLVVDEAGQASPELASAALALSKTAALVGDIKQLAPIWNHSRVTEKAIASRVGAKEDLKSIIRSKRSVASGSALGTARLVSRWTEEDDDSVSLRYHYRCKPSIIAYCNTLCYNNALQTRTNENESFPEPALAWVEIKMEPTSVGGSYQNKTEADEIISWVVERWPQWQKTQAFCNKSIQDIVAIITPYRPQADYISARLRIAFNELRNNDSIVWPSLEDLEKVTVGTVHKLQGAERPIVCFSLVEGPDQASGSFVDRDETLLNVAVSRAKRSFIIFANPFRLFPISQSDQQVALPPTRLLGKHLLERTEAIRLYPNQVVIIEANGKAKTMAKILGKPALVEATNGALWKLDLDGGVDVNAGFVPKPTLEKHTEKVLDKLTEEIASVNEVVIATDDDRMGEYIAWQASHLLAAELNGKSVRRARIGAITRPSILKAFSETNSLNEPLILAEIVREVVDCLVSQRFQQVLKSPARHKMESAEITRLVQIGAVTQKSDYAPHGWVGRVQASVLRLMLDRARVVDKARDQRRIIASVELSGETFKGVVYRELDGKEVTDADRVGEIIESLQGRVLSAVSIPEIRRTPIGKPSAGTVNILISAWIRAGIKPWDAMKSLQALYDGTWSEHADLDFEPLDPIEPSSDSSGHPPLTPLDRAATPEQMQAVMTERDHRIYSIIWDYFINATEPVNLLEINLSFDITDPPTQPPLRVRFDGVSCEGSTQVLQRDILVDRPGAPYRSAVELKSRWRDLKGAQPKFYEVPAQTWDLTMDHLLRTMDDMGIGRPSTIANSLRGLHDKNLITLPIGKGPLQLTPAGLATAIALEAAEPDLSAPAFTRQLNNHLARIESGDAKPREILIELAPLIAPDNDPSLIESRIWNSLSELDSVITQTNHSYRGGSVVTHADAIPIRHTENTLE